MATVSNPPRIVDKVARVLEFLADSGPATAAEIADAVQEPRSSTHRLLTHLESVNWVERSSVRGKWGLGMGLARLGNRAVAMQDFRAEALPYMREIHDKTEETVFLCIRRDLYAVCIERIEGRYVTNHELELGGFIELHAGAAPRVLLAYSPSDVERAWRKSLTTRPITPRTPKTPLDADAIAQHLQQIRKQGHAVSDQDVSVGIAAVGAPIFGHDGNIVAALSVSGVRDVILESSLNVISVVVSAAESISQALGYRSK